MALTHIVRTGNYDDDLDRITGALFDIAEDAYDKATEMTAQQRADIQSDTLDAVSTALESGFEDHVRQIGDAVLDYVKGSLVEELVPAIVEALTERMGMTKVAA